MSNAGPASSTYSFFSSSIQKAALGCVLATAAFPSTLRAAVQRPDIPSPTNATSTPHDYAASVLQGIDGKFIYHVGPAAISKENLPPSKEAYMVSGEQQVLYGVLLEGKELKDNDSCEVIFEKKKKDGDNLPPERVVLLGTHAREIFVGLKAAIPATLRKKIYRQKGWPHSCLPSYSKGLISGGKRGRWVRT